jgi:hypothetical protein
MAIRIGIRNTKHIHNCHLKNSSFNGDNFFGFGSLGVTPRDPRLVGSNPAEVDGFFQDKKILITSTLGGLYAVGPKSEISGSLKNLKPEEIGL